MKFFVTGTDTNIGKTLISSWLALHSSYGYFKPIQTGCEIDSDSNFVQALSGAKIYLESYLFKEPLSPHLAAKLENRKIALSEIVLPDCSNLLVEGAGGLFVPLNDQYFMIDLIKHLNLPVILVSSSLLGCINHTLLSVEALRRRDIEIAAIILNGEENAENMAAIKYYANIENVFAFPSLSEVSKDSLLAQNLPTQLRELLRL